MLNVISGTFSAGAPPIPPETNSYESIATVSVSSAQSTITFSSIPATYKHLQLRGIARQNTGGGTGDQTVTFQLNSDTGSNYTYHRLYGTGSSASADGGASQSNLQGVYAAQAASTASVFAGSIVDILDYTNTNKYKVIRSLAGDDFNGSGTLLFSSGVWLNTAAITTITLTLGGNFTPNSSFALYGIKG
jgi:hypothetical protein